VSFQAPSIVMGEKLARSFLGLRVNFLFVESEAESLDNIQADKVFQEKEEACFHSAVAIVRIE
jgi:hypothetical protein